MPSGNALAFIDNHDTQRNGHVLNFFDPRPYKMAVSFMLSWPYGFPRVMSGFWWERNFQNGHDNNYWHGAPHDENYNILPVTINSDGTCGNGWTCEHRWRQIAHMSKFRGVVGDTDVNNWWDDGNNQIAFSRGDRGFYAVNGDSSKDMDVWLQIGMAIGTYCDVISGDITEDKKSCTGSSIKIETDGKTNIKISKSAEDPMIAFHVDSKLD